MLFGLFPLSGMAEEVPSMLVSKSDGSSLSVEISAVRSIKFQDGNMIVRQNGAADVRLSVDDITMITFGNMETAIASIAGKDNRHEMVIADLSGREIYRGPAAGWSTQRELHGSFVISVEGKSNKVTIK